MADRGFWVKGTLGEGPVQDPFPFLDGRETDTGVYRVTRRRLQWWAKLLHKTKPLKLKADSPPACQHLREDTVPDHHLHGRDDVVLVE